MKKITGWHVLGMFVFGFAIIISVNLFMAFSAIRTFPGTEVANSYVASQQFDRDRDAQLALGWQVSAEIVDGRLRLEILENGTPIAPEIEEAIFGRPTHVQDDQNPEFTFEQDALYAPVQAGQGQWNLRLKARASDGTLFQQRVIVNHP